jgi:hypothetical protein
VTYQYNFCDICGKPYQGYGNNPAPLPGERCCDTCNWTVVIPARLKVVSYIEPRNPDDDK